MLSKHLAHKYTKKYEAFDPRQAAAVTSKQLRTADAMADLLDEDVLARKEVHEEQVKPTKHFEER